MSLSFRVLRRKAFDDPDITLAAMGCVSAIPLIVHFHTALRNPIYTAVGITFLLACLAYLVLRRRLPASIRAQAEATSRVYLLTNALYFGLLTYSIAALYLRPELYTRPLGYFVALAAMAAVLTVEILFLPSRKSATYLALFKIVVIGLSLAWSQAVLYPSVVGVDPWAHQGFTLRILDAGHIPSGYHYSNLPGMHVLVGAAALLTGLDYEMSTVFSVSLLQIVCNILFIFILGEFIHSRKAGLLAGLVLGVANWHLTWASGPIPNGMAVVFIPMIVYLLFKLRQESPTASIGLAALFTAVMIVTHTIAVVMLAMLLFSLWLGFAGYKKLLNQPVPEARVFLVATMLLAGAGLTYWAQDAHHWLQLSRLASAAAAALLPGVGPPAVEPSPLELAVAHYQNVVVPFGERLLNNLGFLLFCGLALLGGLAMLSRRMRNRYGFAFVIAGLTILAASFFVMYPFRDFLIGRFNHLIQILLAIPLAVALLWLGSLPGKRIASACLTGIIVLGLSFLMAMSPQLNVDNRILSPNTIVRYGFTQSELAAMNTAANIHSGTIAGDKNYADLGHIPRFDGIVVSICSQLHSRDFTRSQDRLVLIRDEIVVRPFKIWRLSPFRLDYDPKETLTEQGFAKVYDCGSVSGFLDSR